MTKRANDTLRDGILDVARRLFITEGMERVTMRRIAAELGCSATALYRHFRDKEDLINQVCHHDFQELQGDFLAALEGGDALIRLRAICGAYLRFAQRQPHHYRLLFMTPLSNEQAQSLKATHRDIHGDPSQDGYALLAATLSAAQAEGRLRRDLAPHLLAQVLWAGLHGVIALELDKGNDPWLPWCSFEARSELMLDSLLDGFAASPTPSVQEFRVQSLKFKVAQVAPLRLPQTSPPAAPTPSKTPKTPKTRK
ncbi:MAG: hypothetical protein RL095_3583 [Verrucomicrobiota bacterium]